MVKVISAKSKVKVARVKIAKPFSDADKNALLQLARAAIKEFLAKGAAQDTPKNLPAKLPARLKTKVGVFVSLHKEGQLRGCIGNLAATRQLHKAVEENALAAAFSDPRFSPLTIEELPATNIEISVLTNPRLLRFSSPGDLLKKLQTNFGVILEHKGQTATFLPQVWEMLSDKESFLQNLCLKAGLPADAWRLPETKIYVYMAEVFRETVG